MLWSSSLSLSLSLLLLLLLLWLWSWPWLLLLLCCGPGRPHIARRLCPMLGIGGKRGPLQLQLWAPGAPREARRPRRSTPKSQGPSFLPMSSLRQGCFPLRGLLGPQPHPYGM
eukprot:14751743-Alexandrium_andersonii.AAC.1